MQPRPRPSTLSELRANAIAAGLLLLTVTIGAFLVMALIGGCTMTGPGSAPYQAPTPPPSAVYRALQPISVPRHPMTVPNRQKRPQRQCVGMSGAVTMTLLKMRGGSNQTNNSEIMWSKENSHANR
jgi:hypothetical protein